MKKENIIYTLVGYSNMFNVIPDFVYPIFKSNEDNNYYFQEGDYTTKLITNFVRVKDSYIDKILRLPKEIKQIEVIQGDKAIFVFHVENDKLVCGTYEEVKEFLKTYKTTNSLLQDEIDYFLNGVI